MKKNLFLILAILGLLLPYYFFFRFFSENDFNIALLFEQVFANHVSSAFAMDLILSVIVFWVYVFVEASRRQMKYPGLYVLASLVIGLSFALPLFLYVRERRLEGA